FHAWTTRVSNPVCYPRFRSSASVPAQSAAFAAGVPPDICAFHRYTGNSTLPYWTLATAVSGGVPRLSLGVSHPTYRAAYELFTPNDSGQRSPPALARPLRARYAQRFRTTLPPYVLPRLLARSWPGLLLWVPSCFVPTESGLQPEGRHPARGVAASGFRPLRKIPHCCLPGESGR